jgi:putative Mg2+ transporter-C (MgtC) family protein
MIEILLTDKVYGVILARLVAALVIGCLIGLERSYHNRPAGFRTHALVCVSSTLLMLVTAYQTRLFPSVGEGRITLDPTRMAQGIMTGIGFLGAGTIIKEGTSVRGLTTAASIWITAAIGILVGVGFYFPAAVGTVLTLGTLSVLRWLERKIPSQSYLDFVIRFKRTEAMAESELRRLLSEHGFVINALHYRLDRDADWLEYRMDIRTKHVENTGRLVNTLNGLNAVSEYKVSPMGE